MATGCTPAMYHDREELIVAAQLLRARRVHVVQVLFDVEYLRKCDLIAQLKSGQGFVVEIKSL